MYYIEIGKNNVIKTDFNVINLVICGREINKTEKYINEFMEIFV